MGRKGIIVLKCKFSALYINMMVSVCAKGKSLHMSQKKRRISERGAYRQYSQQRSLSRILQTDHRNIHFGSPNQQVLRLVDEKPDDRWKNDIWKVGLNTQMCTRLLSFITINCHEHTRKVAATNRTLV